MYVGLNKPELYPFRGDYNRVDLEELQRYPNKLLKFFLLVKKEPLPQDLMEQSIVLHTLKLVQDKLLHPGSLSNYHFIKLFCLCPELYSGREKEFADHLNAFIDEFKADYDNPLLLYRAGKVIWLVSDKFPNMLSDELLHPSFYTFDMKPCELIRLPRYPLIKAIPVWRPMLLGTFAAPMFYLPGITREMLLNIIQFIEKGTLPTLSFEKLLEYYAKAHELQNRSLKNACSENLKSFITGETVLQVLHFALKYEDAKLIQACTNCINEAENGLELNWTPAEDLEIKLTQLNETSRHILTEFSAHIHSIVFSDQHIVQTFIDEKVTYPQVTAFELLTDMEPILMNGLGTLFPNVKKCAIPADLYHKLQAENIQTLSNKIEFLRFNDVKKLNRVPLVSIFPNWKAYFHPVPLQRGKTGLQYQIESLRRLGFLFLPDHKTCTKLDLSSLPPGVKSLITDDTLVELIKAYPAIKEINLSGCTKFTDKAALAISGLKNLKKLTLNGCTQVTDSTILSILNSSTRLSTVSLEKCHQITDRAIREISNHFDGEHDARAQLNFSGCSKVTGATIASMIKGSFITELNLSRCPLVTNADVRKILLGQLYMENKDFNRLCLSHNPQLTDFGKLPQRELAHLVPQAGKIDFSYCPNLKESVLMQFASLGYQHINFSGCSNVSSNVIKTLARNALITVSLNDCPQIEDGDIQHLLFFAANNLQKLELKNCRRLTDMVVPNIENLRALSELDLRGCHQVTKAGIDRILALRTLKNFFFEESIPPGDKRTSSQAGL